MRPVLPTHLLNARARRVIESMQQEHVLAHLGQPLAALDDQLRQADVAFDVAVEAAGDDFALDAPLHVGHFFRPLVDQQHDQRDVGIVGRDRRWLMCCRRIVLPVRGGATISARWPLPSGVSRSITRVVSGCGPGFQLAATIRG